MSTGQPPVVRQSGKPYEADSGKAVSAIRLNITKGGAKLSTNSFIRADEVAKELGVSRSYAYKLIKQLNEELRKKGYITVAGRVSRRYFDEKLYNGERDGR